jgi:pimeloyl-ACP methyl ester carboxylesterase
VSTPTSLDLPDGVRRTTIHTGRGRFAALEAIPASGGCERDTALLIPGYTGSKEDFLSVLDQLADGGRRVVAIDMRGQFETAGTDDPDGYSAAELGADILALISATGARHLLGHSYGGLIAREALLAGTGPTGTGLAGTGQADTGPGGTEQAGTGQAGTGPGGGSGLDGTGGSGDGIGGSGDGIGSLTLMSSGPGALTGPRADELRAMLTALGVHDAHTPAVPALRTGVAGLWHEYLEPQAVAAGVPGPIVAFLGRRMLSNDPSGLIHMARHLLAAPDRTPELARLVHVPMLVLYGENDNSWSPTVQEDMAGRLGADRVCIPGAAHSPAVEAPATTASALTRFWDTAEATTAMQAAGRMA